jgi:hypothetical protein
MMAFDDMLEALGDSDVEAVNRTIADALLSAESCENEADLKANIRDARDAARRLVAVLDVLLMEFK